MAKAQTRPTFIEIDTIIGEGLPGQASYEAHGEVITDEGYAHFKKYYGYENITGFEFDPKIYEHFQNLIIKRGNQAFEQ